MFECSRTGLREIVRGDSRLSSDVSAVYYKLTRTYLLGTISSRPSNLTALSNVNRCLHRKPVATKNSYEIYRLGLFTQVARDATWLNEPMGGLESSFARRLIKITRYSSFISVYLINVI